MAHVDDPAAIAARRIIMAEETPFTDPGSEPDRIEAYVRNFYALVQLTPEVELPGDLLGEIEGALESGLNQGSSGESGSADTFRKKPANRRMPGSRRFGKKTAAQTGRARVRLPVAAAALLLAALLLSLAANLIMLRGDPFQPETAVYLSGSDAAPNANGVLLYDGESIVLHASGLAQLSPGYRYVAWHATESGETYLGPLTMLSRTTGRLLVDASEVGFIVSVTIESDPAPEAPGGPRILVGLQGE